MYIESEVFWLFISRRHSSLAIVSRLYKGGKIISLFIHCSLDDWFSDIWKKVVKLISHRQIIHVILQLKFYVSKLKTVISCFIKVYRRRRMRIVRMTSDSSCLYLTLILLLSNIICNRYNRHHASHKFLRNIQLSNGFGSLFLEFFWSLKW